ncbi:MAG: hypothetical protein QOJ84_4042 [Bradyrhizobium sp.]|jgi:hypothetical protein|nr:hypothetical protein [Bradyrhizobium sp.]
MYIQDPFFVQITAAVHHEAPYVAQSICDKNNVAL